MSIFWLGVCSAKEIRWKEISIVCDNHDGLLCTSKPECPHCGSTGIEKTAFGNTRKAAPGSDIAALHRNQAICICEAAGREVVEQGTISPGTQAVLDRPIIDPEMYVNNTNAYLGSILANHPE